MITPTVYKNKDEIALILNEIDVDTIVIISKSAANRYGFILDINPHILWIYNIDSNPTPTTLYKALLKIKQNNFSVTNIIAIGGGSVIDLAKGIIALHSIISTKFTIDIIRDRIRDKKYLEYKMCYHNFVAVPTTAGTGSEATQWATIWDDKSNLKYSIDSPLLYPTSILIVPELTLGLSPRLTAATGLDAVSHAIEAYWAKSSDSLSQSLSIRALEILVPNLSNLYNKIEHENIDWREQLCTGSYISGLSFSRTRTTACHSISYPLTSMFGMEHGFAVAITLDSIAKINSEKIDLTEIFKIFDNYGGIQSWIYSVAENIADMNLASFGVKKDDIQSIVDKAFTGGRMDNNPVELSKNDVKNILIESF